MDDLERAAAIAADNRSPMPTVERNLEWMYHDKVQAEEAAYRQKRHREHTAREQALAEARRAERRRRHEQMLQQHAENRARKAAEKAAKAAVEAAVEAVRLQEHRDAKARRNAEREVRKAALNGMTLAEWRAQRRNKRIENIEGPELPPYRLSTRDRRPICYRYSETAMKERVLWSTAYGKIRYTWLEAIRIAQRRGMSYYLCPYEGDHWHLTRDTDGPDSIPGTLTRRAPSDTVPQSTPDKEHQ